MNGHNERAFAGRAPFEAAAGRDGSRTAGGIRGTRGQA